MRIIDKCTRPDREDRFESVAEVARELRAYPVRKKLRKVGYVARLALASAAAALVIAATTTHAEDIREKASVSIEARLPVFKERMNNVKVRINGFFEEQFGEKES